MMHAADDDDNYDDNEWINDVNENNLNKCIL